MKQFSTVDITNNIATIVFVKNLSDATPPLLCYIQTDYNKGIFVRHFIKIVKEGSDKIKTDQITCVKFCARNVRVEFPPQNTVYK